MAETSIEWTDATWNPIVGCSRVSKGCENCYAERVAHRGMSEQHRGLTVLGKKGPRWTGEVRFLAERLSEPLRWRKPRRVFVNSMSDLFHGGASDEQIAAVFGVMAAAPMHTFQVLTKRPERAARWFAWASSAPIDPTRGGGPRGWRLCTGHALDLPSDDGAGRLYDVAHEAGPWPLPNVWLGVSVEDQATADERIPILLDTPAAVRWVSYEPALAGVDFTPWLPIVFRPPAVPAPGFTLANRTLDWIVVGGESGPGARPFAIEWAARTVAQCRAAGVPVFVKQLGALVVSEQRVDEAGAWAWRAGLRDRKGGDPSEWPEDLRVREWPEVRPAVVRDALSRAIRREMERD